MFLNKADINDKNNALINALNLVGIGIDIVSVNHEILFQNQVLKERFGDFAGEICYKKYMALDKPCEFCPMEKAIKNNSVERIELKGVDGRFYEIYSAPIPNSDGFIDMVAEIVIDITNRRRNEQKILESEEKFKSISEQNLMGITIIQDNLVKYVNKTLADIYGYSLEEVYDWKPSEFLKLIAPEFLEIVRVQVKKKQEGNGDVITHYQYRGIKKSGEKIWVDNFSKTIQYDDRPADLIMQIDMTEKRKFEEELRDSEQKYRALFDGANDSIFLMKEYKFVECNKKSLEIFGYEQQSEILGLYPWDISPIFQPNGMESKKMAIDYMNNALNGNAQRFYWKHQKKDGNFIDAEVSLNCILIKNTCYLQAIVRDVTDKVKSERELKESEEKFRILAEQSLMGINIVQENQIKYINQAYLDIFGYSLEEIMAFTLEDVKKAIHPDDREFALDQLKKKQEGGADAITHYQYRGVKKSGQIIWVETYSKTIIFEGGLADFITIIDITKSKNAENKLKVSEKKYRELFEESPVGIMLFNDSYDLVAVNDKIQTLISEVYNKFVQGRSFIELIQLFKNSKELSKIFVQRIDLLKSGYKTEPIELKAVMPSGLEKWFLWQSSTIHLSENKNLLQIIILDITEKKEAEILVIEERQRIQKLNDMRQELVTRISHELNTPVTSVYGALQVLLDIHENKMSKEILELMKIIEKGTKRLRTLIETLVNASKFDYKKQELNLQEKNILKIVRDQVHELEFYAKSRDIRCDVDLPPKFMIYLDKMLFEQVITNILSNAINNTLPGGRIFVNFKETKDYIDIIIRDTGVGITQEEKTRLFKRFGKIERYGKGENVYIEGAGMGLYISKEIVELHRGQIFVESEGKNKGSTFTVRLFKKDLVKKSES